MKLLEPLIDAATGEVVADAEAKLTARQARRIAETTKEVLVGRADLLGRYMAEDLVDHPHQRKPGDLVVGAVLLILIRKTSDET